MFDAIVVPQGAEYKAVIKGLKKSQKNKLRVIAIPIGMNQIDLVLERANFWETQPKRVLMTGLCGSLNSQYSVGDFALYRDCYNQNDGQFLVTDANLNRLVRQKISSELVTGLICDFPIIKVTKKQQLGKKFSAQVADMESFAYLDLFQQSQIAVSILRVVSDDLKFDLPNLESAISPTGNIKPWAMAKAMSQKPIASFHLIKGSIQALKKLQQVISIL